MKILKLTTLALSFSLLASAFAGSETGGGGDAITQKDKLVLRDFVEDSVFDTVLDNEKFLQGIPGLKEIITEISLFAPEFADEILQDLLHASIFYSKTPLPLLSSNLTTMYGTKAEVQLAIRQGSEIYLSPKLKKPFPDMAYLLIHEGLHSILNKEENSPKKHQKIRTIVNYLKENRGKLSEDLVLLLNKVVGERYSKVWFYPSESSSVKISKDFVRKALMDNKLPEVVRCYWSSEFFVNDISNHSFAFNYLQGLDCKGSRSMEEFVTYMSSDSRYSPYLAFGSKIKERNESEIQKLSCAELTSELGVLMNKIYAQPTARPVEELTGTTAEDLTVRYALESEDYEKVKDEINESVYKYNSSLKAPYYSAMARNCK